MKPLVKYVATTMIYTHVLNKPGLGVPRFDGQLGGGGARPGVGG